MGSMKKWMLAAALAAGTVGLGASQAQAARIGIGVYVGGPSVYVPPCPGPGYAWVAGYYNGGYWTPGFWRAPEPRPEVIVRGGYGWRGPVYGRDFDHDQHFDRGHDGFRR
jgi:hypothetical protein